MNKFVFNLCKISYGDEQVDGDGRSVTRKHGIVSQSIDQLRLRTLTATFRLDCIIAADNDDLIVDANHSTLSGNVYGRQEIVTGDHDSLEVSCNQLIDDSSRIRFETIF